MARNASLVAILFAGMIVLMGTTLALRTVFLTPIIPANAIIQVWEEGTEQGIPGVRVKFDLVTWPYKKGVIDYEATTNQDGIAYSDITPGGYYILLEKPGYETAEFGPYRLDSGENRLNFHIVESGGGGGGNTCRIYLRTSDARIQTGACTLDGVSYASDEAGLILIYNLDAGDHVARFQGSYKVEGQSWPTRYDFTVGFFMPDNDQEYVCWVDTGFLESGEPPEPPESQLRLWVAATVLFSAGFLTFALLFQGRGPELVGLIQGGNKK